MKAVRAGSDQQLELSMYADGKLLKEYVLPGSITDQNIVECFVPVEAMQKLVIKGRFIGTVLAASFDLVVDGSFVGDERILEKEAAQYSNRALEFERAYDCPPEKAGWTSRIEGPLDIWDAEMFVEELGEMVDLSAIEYEDDSLDRPGVGSIQILANVQNESHEHRFDPEWDINGGGWLLRSAQPVRASGVQPDCAIEIRHTGPDKIPQKRSRIHRNHWNVETRYGIEPWARFIFWYRKQASIDAAGCILRTERFRELNPPQEDLSEAVEMIDAPAWDAQPRATDALRNMTKYSKLGGDFSAQITNKQPPLQAVGRPARRESNDEGQYYGVAHRLDNTGNLATSDRNTRWLDPLTSAKRAASFSEDDASDSLFVTDTPSVTRFSSVTPFSLGNTTMPPVTESLDMATFEQHLGKLPAQAELTEFIGADGCTRLETSKYFNKIAKERGFPPNGSVRMRLRKEYNSRIMQISEFEEATEQITLRNQHMPPAIAHEQDEEDTIFVMPKQHRNKPPPAPMVAPTVEEPPAPMPSPALSAAANVLKRSASQSATPDVIGKKARLLVDNTAAVEAARRKAEETRQLTAKLMKEHQERLERKAAKKAQKAAEKKQAQYEANAQELKALEEEERAQQEQIAALKAMAAADEDDEEDDEEDSEQEDGDAPDSDAGGD